MFTGACWGFISSPQVDVQASASLCPASLTAVALAELNAAELETPSPLRLSCAVLCRGTLGVCSSQMDGKASFVLAQDQAFSISYTEPQGRVMMRSTTVTAQIQTNCPLP